MSDTSTATEAPELPRGHRQVAEALAALLSRVLLTGLAPDSDYTSPFVEDLLVLIDGRIHALHTASSEIFGIWCTPKVAPKPSSSHEDHPGWLGEDADGHDPSVYSSKRQAAEEQADHARGDGGSAEWIFEVRPYRVTSCPMCAAPEPGVVPLEPAAVVQAAPRTLPEVERELEAVEQVADRQRERAKLAEASLGELQEDRRRALRRAYELTQDAQTLDEAVAALVECVRRARAQREEAERKLTAVGTEHRALRQTNVELHEKLRIVQAGRDDVWLWQGQGDDTDTLACPVVMSADTLRTILAKNEDLDAGNLLRLLYEAHQRDHGTAHTFLDWIKDEALAVAEPV
jgi:hypothetical protein